MSNLAKFFKEFDIGDKVVINAFNLGSSDITKLRFWIRQGFVEPDIKEAAKIYNDLEAVKNGNAILPQMVYVKKAEPVEFWKYMINKSSQKELLQKYNDELKNIKTYKDFAALKAKIDNEDRIWFHTKKRSCEINSFFEEKNNKICYITNQDAYERHCEIKNLYKFVVIY